MTSTPSGISLARRRPGWYDRRRWIGIIGWELLHAALWMPMVLFLLPATLLFHLSIPLGAALERIVARRLGADAYFAAAEAARSRGERRRNRHGVGSVRD